MKYYPSEPVGVVGTFRVVKTYTVTVYADDEDSLYDAIEEETIKEDDLIDVSYEMTDVDSAGF
jgi:hypothetical protein